MEDLGILGNLHPSLQLIMTLLVSLVGVTLLIFIGGILLIPFFGTNVITDMGGDLTSSENINISKYLQIFSHLGLFILPSLLLAWLFGGSVKKYLFLSKTTSGKTLIIAALLIFAFVPFINYIYEINMKLDLPDSLQAIENWMRESEESAQLMTEAFLNVETLSGLLFNIFMIGVIPSIGEEFMFRGVLMRIFNKWISNIHIVVILTSVIFSLIHIQFFGFLPRMLLGVLFGYLVVYTGSLWPAMLAHFVNNSAAVIFFYFYGGETNSNTFDNLGTGANGIYFASISALFTVGLIILIKRINNKKENNKISNHLFN